MTPPVSSLIRNTLYPDLEDHELVLKYPNVVGMAKNLFFMHHTNPEKGGGDSGSSNSNPFEAAMACDLALYLLKQGCYSQEGDIVILCAYLGQMLEIRERLKGKVTIIVDERDQEKLTKAFGDGDDEDATSIPLSGTTAKQVDANKQIFLRTVDNFQGEEAAVVILSLVRNAGADDKVSSKMVSTIGFLRSRNRTNVALSRAKHGMYILGNADQLASSSEMWRTIIHELEDEDAIGAGFPIACKLHQEIKIIGEPGVLNMVSPDVASAMPMTSSTSMFAASRGADASTSRAATRASAFAQTTVASARFQSTASICLVATRPASSAGSPRTSKLSGAQPASPNYYRYSPNEAPKTDVHVVRTEHAEHACGAFVPSCGHPCGYACGSDHKHSTTTCIAPCHRVCDHDSCPSSCNQPCAPCAESCTWACEHHQCAMPCGMPCDRLPCDQLCQKNLLCGHPCPSLCGEPCNTQVCTTCATSGQLEQVVDLIMQSTLRDTLNDDPGARFVTLNCGHIFTVETLDGHMDLSSYYENVGGKWCGLLAPTGYQKRKTCPSCRASISSPRYSRVTKRALLDLQEQVAVMRFAAVLQAHSTTLVAIKEEGTMADVKKILNQVFPSSVTKFEGKRMVAELGTFTNKMVHCVSVKAFTGDESNMFGISGVLGNAWRKVAHRHLDLYAGLAKLVHQDGMPHSVAYQGAISSIFFKELDIARESSASATRDPKKAALLMARRRVGAPPPQGQTVYSVEALALTIEVRLKMFRVALSFVDHLWNGEGVRGFKGRDDPKHEHEAITASRKGAVSFQCLATGLLLSCIRDAQVMIGRASKSELPRLVLQGHFLWLDVAFNLTRYKSVWALRQLAGEAAVTMRTGLVQRSVEERAHCNKRFLKALGVLSVEQKKNEPFLAEAEKIRGLAEKIVDDWVEFEHQLQRNAELSLEEKRDVLRAVLTRDNYGDNYNSAVLMAGMTGNIYQCQNGHPYIIGDCGQAMVEATCNECGEGIGGGGHQLRGDNRPDTELEEVVRSLDHLGARPVDPFVARW
ncbi:hypothetical protein CspHIS471_0200430 [Cutaneotrichosporon sp. HIS471]|nr:hypothetical protein CspHIS471_0200430 [Cutaneotrichosporon sp. HIS471]